MLLERGHESVIEHAYASFPGHLRSRREPRVRTASSIQLQSGEHALLQLLQSKYGKEISVIKPPGMNAQSEALWQLHCEDAEGRYMKMRAGLPPEIARSILPTA